MFARVATVHVQLSKLDEAIRVYTDQVVPALQCQAGFEGVELLVNRETGHGISITRWATRADQHASERSGFYRDQVVSRHWRLFSWSVRRYAGSINVRNRSDGRGSRGDRFGWRQMTLTNGDVLEHRTGSFA